MSEPQNQEYPVIRDNQSPAYHNSNGLPDFTLVAHPVRVTCPYCHKEGESKVTSKIGVIQWIVCLILCLVGCWCYCCIPFCIKDLRDATHTCQH